MSINRSHLEERVLGMDAFWGFFVAALILWSALQHMVILKDVDDYKNLEIKLEICKQLNNNHSHD